MTGNFSNYFVEAFETLQDAILGKKDVDIEYEKWDGEKSFRKISPKRFTYVERYKTKYSRLCVKAFCHLRGEDRVFAVVRIKDARII